MLRRFFVFAALAVLGLIALSGLSAVPAQAQDAPPDLTALTEYFPDDTIIYAAARIDDAFIDELDALWAHITSKLPPGAVPPMGVKQALDMAVREGYGRRATFANTFSGWLGDTAAIGVGSIDVLFDRDYRNDADVPIVGAISITNAGDAESFLDDVAPRANLDEKEDMGADGILYTASNPTPGSVAFLLLDDVLLIAPSADALTERNRLEKTVRDNPNFTGMLAMLPEQHYHILAYLDIGPTLADIYRQMFAQMGSMMPEGMGGMMNMALTVYENYPPMAIGFTLLDGRSLTMDYAVGAFDMSAIEEAMGLGPMTVPAPVDSDFARYVPADAPLVIHGTGAGESAKRSLQAMVYMVDAFKEMAFMFSDMGGSSSMDEIPPFVRDITGSDVRAFINLAFAGMTGLNLEKDVLDHLNGNSVFYLRFLLSDVLGYTLDGAVVFENAEPDAMQKIFDGLVGALEQYKGNFTREGDAVVLPGLIRAFFPAGMPEAMMAAPELDFLFGLNDNVFAFGTRTAVEYSLDPSGDSLADNPAYQEASTYFLDDTVMVWYLGFAPIIDALNIVAGSETVDRSTARDLTTASTVLSIFTSASITARMDENYSGVGRFVLTLAE